MGRAWPTKRSYRRQTVGEPRFPRYKKAIQLDVCVLFGRGRERTHAKTKGIGYFPSIFFIADNRCAVVGSGLPANERIVGLPLRHLVECCLKLLSDFR